MKEFLTLLRESLPNTIGGLIVALVLAVLTYLYKNRVWLPHIFGFLSIFFFGFFAYPLMVRLVDYNQLVPSTEIATRQATVSVPNGKVVQIEALDNFVYSYSDIKGTDNKLNLIWLHNDIDYKFEYQLPDTGEGYSGFVFQFNNSQDFTQYQYIEVEISFDTGAKCDITLEDKRAKPQYIRLGGIEFDNGVNIELSKQDNRQDIKIPLRTNFGEVDQTAVTKLGFSTYTGFTRGSHSFTVHQVKLVK